MGTEGLESYIRVTSAGRTRGPMKTGALTDARFCGYIQKGVPSVSKQDGFEEKADDAFKKMVEGNEWHTGLQELVDAVRFCTGQGFVWSWTRTPGWQCKYIDVRIDMRDGGFVVKAGHGKPGERISLEQLKRWGLKSPEGGGCE